MEPHTDSSSSEADEGEFFDEASIVSFFDNEEDLLIEQLEKEYEEQERDQKMRLDDGLEGVASLLGMDVHESNMNVNSKGILAMPDEGHMTHEKLVLSGCSKVTKLPEFGESMEDLSLLDLENTAIVELPESLGFLIGLVTLNLKGCKNLVCLPRTFKNLKYLKTLNMFGSSKFSKLPDDLNENEALENLDVGETSITEVPPSIAQLRNLKAISFYGCKGPACNTLGLPHFLGRMLGWNPVPMSLVLPPLSSLTSLRELNLSYCGLDDGSIPGDISCLSSLQNLELRGNNFVNLPTGCISNLLKLQFLNLSCCPRLKSLPNLPAHLVRLDAGDCSSLESLSDEQLWYHFSLLDHQGRYRRDDLHMFSNANFKKENCYPHNDFIALMPGSEVPSWFPNRNDSCLLKENEVAFLTIDISECCGVSEWSRVAICLVLDLFAYEDNTVSHPSHHSAVNPPFIWWGCDVPYDKAIPLSWGHTINAEEGDYPLLCFMLLNFSDQRRWQHLIRNDSNRIEISIDIVENRHESDLIENIVGAIWTKLWSSLPSYNDNLVGIESRIVEMSSLLKIGLDDGTEAIQGMVLDLQEPYEAYWVPEAFAQMRNLRLLILSSECLGKLKFIDVSHSQNLIKTPNFVGVPNLERLILEGCISLVEVHPSLGELKMLVEDTLITELPESFGFLTGLEHLNLKGCKNLVSLPHTFNKLKHLRTLNLSSCSKFSKLPENLNENEALENLDASNSHGLKALPNLPPGLVRLNAGNCPSMEPLSDEQLWYHFSSLDSQFPRRSDNFHIPGPHRSDDFHNIYASVGSPLNYRDFMVCIPGNEILSWFPDKKECLPASEDSNISRISMTIDIPQCCLESEWSRIALCHALDLFDHSTPDDPIEMAYAIGRSANEVTTLRGHAIIAEGDYPHLCIIIYEMKIIKLFRAWNLKEWQWCGSFALTKVFLKQLVSTDIAGSINMLQVHFPVLVQKLPYVLNHRLGVFQHRPDLISEASFLLLDKYST
ncbi:TMV resistance protein N-like [Senna tora]|uniref:TMV resistance protein N-like n=1 Tax=Senna tora TaxID=362788 RepID=A0A834WW76_9FABA|nr:TMV resistance protein N-like [Senna tora]